MISPPPRESEPCKIQKLSNVAPFWQIFEPERAALLVIQACSLGISLYRFRITFISCIQLSSPNQSHRLMDFSAVPSSPLGPTWPSIGVGPAGASHRDIAEGRGPGTPELSHIIIYAAILSPATVRKSPVLPNQASSLPESWPFRLHPYTAAVASSLYSRLQHALASAASSFATFAFWVHPKFRSELSMST